MNYLMAKKVNHREILQGPSHKDFKKSNLDILTEENDRLLKNLKRPGGSYRAA